MIKIHKTYLHERPEAPSDAPARRLDDRRRLRRVLADAPPAEALEGARARARGRAEERRRFADGAAPPPLLLAEAPAERAPPPGLAERGVAADVTHVGAGVEVGRRGAAAAQARAQRVVGRRPLGVVVPEQPAVPDALAAAPVAVQGLGLGPGRRARRGERGARADRARAAAARRPAPRPPAAARPARPRRRCCWASGCAAARAPRAPPRGAAQSPRRRSRRRRSSRAAAASASFFSSGTSSSPATSRRSYAVLAFVVSLCLPFFCAPRVRIVIDAQLIVEA